MSKKPNIVFFFTDDQRFNTINVLGNDEIITPNIDMLVKRGITFTQAHIPSGTIGAICMPSRAMLHTGRTLFHIQGAGENIPEEHTTIGEALQQNGYFTWGAGKWHNGKQSFNRSFVDGNEIFFGGMSDHWNVPVFNYDPECKYDEILLMCPDPMFSNKTYKRNCDHVHSGYHSTDLISDAAIEFISKYKDDKPFFMYLSYLAPHDPRTMPKEFLEMYDSHKIKLPENFMENHPFDNGDLKIRDEMLAPFPRTPDDTLRQIAEYYAMITHLDANLGRVLNALEEKGVLKNTIIVFAGDNGLAVGQHGLFGKQNCYEHSIRVPLIFAGPGIPKNARSDALVYLFDIFPTLCDLIEIAIPPSIEGKSLVSAINDPNEKVRKSLYFAYTRCQRAIKSQHYKLIEYVVNRRPTHTQLFNLKNDPLELNNLAENSEFSDKIEELRREMFRLRDEWEDDKSKWGKKFWKAFQKGKVT